MQTLQTLANSFEMPSDFMQCLGNLWFPRTYGHVLCVDSLLGLLEQLFWKIPTLAGESMALFFFYRKSEKGFRGFTIFAFPCCLFVTSFLFLVFLLIYLLFFLKTCIFFACVNWPWAFQTIFLPARLFLAQTFFKFFCCSTATKSQAEIALSPPGVFAVLLFLVCTGPEKAMTMT